MAREGLRVRLTKEVEELEDGLITFYEEIADSVPEAVQVELSVLISRAGILKGLVEEVINTHTLV